MYYPPITPATIHDTHVDQRIDGAPVNWRPSRLQPHYSCQSTFVQARRAQHAHEMGFSKYCIGIALHRPEIKQNWFKPALLRMARFH